VFSLTKTIPVDADNGRVLHIPLPTRRHHVARAAYKVMLAAFAVAAIGALVRTDDPQTVYGAVLTILLLPALLYVEYKIRRAGWKEEHKLRRAILFAAELVLPMTALVALPAMPAVLHAYGFQPSINELAFIDVGYMFIVGLGGTLTNRVWALHWLGYEN
jgi:uncharacterized membrane protein YfcA